MRTWKLPVVAVLAGVMSLLAAGTASADSPRAYHGNDWGQIRTLPQPGSYNDRIIVCDAEGDGAYVWAQYHLVNASGFSEYRNVYDLDGPNNNSCGIHDYQGTPYWARAVRVCEYEGGCGRWVYIPEALATAGKQSNAS